MDAAEICEKAAEILSERKWCQGALMDEVAKQDTAICAFGAIYMATGYFEWNGSHWTNLTPRRAVMFQPLKFITSAANEVLGTSLTTFNDQADSKEDVVLALKRVAEKLREDDE